MVKYGGAISMPSSQPKLVLEYGRQMTWCGEVTGVNDLFVTDQGTLYTDYPAHGGIETQEDGTTIHI